MRNTWQCPSCNQTFSDGTVICTDCGIHLPSGKPVSELNLSPQEPPQDQNDAAANTADDEPEENAVNPVLQMLQEYLPGLFSIKLLVLSLVTLALAVTAGILGLFVLSMGAMMAGISLIASGFVLYAHTVAWIQCGYFGWLASLLVDYEGKRWAIFFFFVFGPVLAGMMVMGYIGSSQAA